ncbi:hypothetical protein J3E68DRAFT_405377 [Trichoderma sp. SZMC 28012]
MTPPERPRGQEHIPDYPKAWIWMRVFQIVTSLVVLFLSIHALEEFHVPTDLQVVMIVISASTVGVSILLIIAQFASPRIFRYWTPLISDCAVFVAWAVSAPLLIEDVSDLVAKRGTVHGSGDNPVGHRHDGSNPIPTNHVDTLYAIGAMGCLEIGLFFLSWVVDSIVINRHRKAGLPCRPVKRRASFADGSQTRSMKVSPPMKPRTKKPRRGLSAIFGFGSDGGAGGGGGYDGGCDGGGGGGSGGCDGG